MVLKSYGAQIFIFELKCSYLIGQGSDFYLQYASANVLSIAFRNGMTLENRPKNEAVRANSLF